MACYTVGCVPYINAIPLITSVSPAVNVVFDVPSRLPALLEDGHADAILVSSVDALRVPGRRMAADVCIGSRGAVKSVRLFSKVPFNQIQTLALDESSMTSNRLAQILLAEHGVRPSGVSLKPDLRAMLAVADACVLIGDIGMSADGTGLHVMDLGAEWLALTGKPFVWAAWIGGDGLTLELAAEVALALDAAPELEELVSIAEGKSSCTAEEIRDYFAFVMEYRMTADMMDGLREFQRLLLANGFDDCTHFPELVSASSYALRPVP